MELHFKKLMTEKMAENFLLLQGNWDFLKYSQVLQDRKAICQVKRETGTSLKYYMAVVLTQSAVEGNQHIEKLEDC